MGNVACHNLDNLRGNILEKYFVSQKKCLTLNLMCGNICTEIKKGAVKNDS